jgi:rubrerythrin
MAKNFFKCRVCGDIHYGMNGPAICPTCQTKNAYESIDKETAKKAMGF